MKSNFSPRTTQRHAAFTLIELLVVIAIIAILAGLLIQTAGAVQEKAARSRAEAEIKGIESALESYKLDFGTYPDDPAHSGNGGDTSTGLLITELAKGPRDEPEKYNNRKPYEFSLRILSGYKPSVAQSYDTVLNASTSLVDPFGNAYHYKFPGDPKRSGEEFYDLFSKGKKNAGDNNSTDAAVTVKWIKNW